MVAQTGGRRVRIEAIDDRLRVGEAMNVDHDLAEGLANAGPNFLKQVEKHGADVGAGGAGDALLASRVVVKRGREAQDNHLSGLIRHGIGGDDGHRNAR